MADVDLTTQRPQRLETLVTVFPWIDRTIAVLLMWLTVVGTANANWETAIMHDADFQILWLEECLENAIKKYPTLPNSSNNSKSFRHCTLQSNLLVKFVWLRPRSKLQRKLCSKSCCNWCNYDNSNPCETRWNVSKATCNFYLTGHCQKPCYKTGQVLNNAHLPKGRASIAPRSQSANNSSTPSAPKVKAMYIKT